MSGRYTPFRGLLLSVMGLLPFVTAAAAQEEPARTPLAGFLVSGYGSATYNSIIEEDSFQSNLQAAVSPILLYSMGSALLFEAELEFELEDGGTETTLEYAQIDYLGFDRIVLTAGKFLLPFGVFSERLHPSWINKLPRPPLLYGHGHGGVAEGALTPILSDVGLMGRYSLPLDDLWSLDLSVYVTQGPREAEHDEGDGEEGDGDGHAHSVRGLSASASAAQPDEHDFEIPGLAFGTNFSDNNDSKMLGARLGVIRGGGFEAYLSGFHAMYDADDYLDVVGANLSAEWRRGKFELRGEGAILWQEFEQDAEFPTARTPAYYLQASRRVGDFEPVVRWSHLMETKVEGEVARDERRQLAFGLNYWLRPSVPVKLAFEVDLDGAERLILQWAYGF